MLNIEWKLSFRQSKYDSYHFMYYVGFDNIVFFSQFDYQFKNIVSNFSFIHSNRSHSENDICKFKQTNNNSGIWI